MYSCTVKLCYVYVSMFCHPGQDQHTCKHQVLSGAICWWSACREACLQTALTLLI